MPSKKILLVLFFISSSVSFLELFRITTNSKSFNPLLSTPSANPILMPRDHAILNQAAAATADKLTLKEQKLLSDIISMRAPCHLLFFGLKPQLLSIATHNVGGTTVFLEDNWEKQQTPWSRSESINAYQVHYHATASEAYTLLRHARADPACTPHEPRMLQASSCLLALKNLPKEIYEKKWDVIVVDGPSGDNLEAPGRMAAIYSAGIMARSVGSVCDVLVHDVDRTIERWYSWEFLCHKNLVASKGKLWHFRIEGNLSSSRFCPE